MVLMYRSELGRFDLLTRQAFFLTEAKFLPVGIRKFEKRDSSEISRMIKIMRFENPSMMEYVALYCILCGVDCTFTPFHIHRGG